MRSNLMFLSDVYPFDNEIFVNVTYQEESLPVNGRTVLSS